MNLTFLMVKLAASVDLEIVSYKRLSGNAKNSIPVNPGNKRRHTYMVEQSLLCQIQISVH